MLHEPVGVVRLTAYNILLWRESIDHQENVLNRHDTHERLIANAMRQSGDKEMTDIESSRKVS